MSSHPARGAAATATADPLGTTNPDARPEPGPAPPGPAVRVPEQQPAATPSDPGPAPPGPAAEPGGGKG